MGVMDLINGFKDARSSIDGAQTDKGQLWLSESEIGAMYEIYAKPDKSWAERLAIVYAESQLDSASTVFGFRSIARSILGTDYEAMRFEHAQADALVSVVKQAAKSGQPVDAASLYEQYVGRVSAMLDE